MNKSVYIILINWNQYKDTKECLSSLDKVEYDNYKVLVVDNASRDGSIDKLQKEFPKLEYIVNRQNLGFTGGNNVGMKKALSEGAEYILLLNNDTIVKPDFLDNLVKIAESDPKIGAIGPKILYYDSTNIVWYAGGKISKITGQTHHIGLNKIDSGQYEETKEVDFITGCTFFVKSHVLQEVGLLDDDYFYSYEDVDLSYRIKKAGYKLVYCPKSVVYHKFARSAGGRFSPLYIYYRVRNNLLYDVKSKRPKTQLLFHLLFSPLKHIIYGILTLNYLGVKSAYLSLSDFITHKYGKGSFNA